MADHPTLLLIVGLLLVATLFTIVGFGSRDTRGFFINLSSEAWGAFATVAVVESVLRRQRLMDERPLRRLLDAELATLMWGCRELEKVINSLGDDTPPGLLASLERMGKTSDEIASGFANMLSGEALASLLKFRHATRLAADSIRESSSHHKARVELERVLTEGGKLHTSLSGAKGSEA